ncbi:MAG: metal-dependent hydrolase [Actinomycetia bacterium]|nr:metal-dependent hydrolase [Actinomycetes bacterium]
MTDTAPLRVRRPDFTFGPETDPAWTPLRPEFACAANSVSILMPHMEPYFVRSVAAALPELDDELAMTARAYNSQEMEHQRLHGRFNAILIEKYPKLAVVVNVADRVYRWLGNSRSVEFNIAFVATSETIAYAAARWSAAHRQELFEGADPEIAALYQWHLAEEVEHKAAVHDVYQAIGGRRLRYLGAMLSSLALVVSLIGMGTVIMLAATGRWWHPLAWLRLIRWAVTFVFELITLLVMSLLPQSHPNQLTDPLWLEVWLRELDSGRAPSP